MSTFVTGAARKGSASRRHRLSRPAEVGRPNLRWRYRGNPLGRWLLQGFFVLAEPLLIWQQRVRDRETLRRLPDHMLKDIGIDRADLREEADKPFWRA
jgi:uncharacterized protein YjiS (DUF1127 family)